MNINSFLPLNHYLKKNRLLQAFLKKKRPGITGSFYHGTTLGNAQSICKHGVVGGLWITEHRGSAKLFSSGSISSHEDTDVAMHHLRIAALQNTTIKDGKYLVPQDWSTDSPVILELGLSLQGRNASLPRNGIGAYLDEETARLYRVHIKNVIPLSDVGAWETGSDGALLVKDVLVHLIMIGCILEALKVIVLCCLDRIGIPVPE